MMEAAGISEASVDIYQTTRRNNPEDSHFLYHLSFLRVRKSYSSSLNQKKITLSKLSIEKTNHSLHPVRW
jgi:hypothetical protein